MSAMFLMACRNKNSPGSRNIPQLVDQDQAQQETFKLRQHLGEINQSKRKKDSQLSLKKTPPSDAEIELLHNLLIVQDSSGDVIKIEDSRLEKNIFAHEQNKNVHGKLFGGNIMRECFELAFMTAYMQGTGDFPILYHIGDTQVFFTF